MHRELFLRIANAVESRNEYFVQKQDAVGRLGLSPLQKITTALRILAYGCSADHCDEDIKIGQPTAITTVIPRNQKSRPYFFLLLYTRISTHIYSHVFTYG